MPSHAKITSEHSRCRNNNMAIVRRLREECRLLIKSRASCAALPILSVCVPIHRCSILIPLRTKSHAHAACVPSRPKATPPVTRQPQSPIVLSFDFCLRERPDYPMPRPQNSSLGELLLLLGPSCPSTPSHILEPPADVSVK